MGDNISQAGEATVGHQIRRLREARGWTLSHLARRAGTSAPALHRYEGGWDRFALTTLRKIAFALGARIDVRLVPARRGGPPSRRPSRRRLVKSLSPLFWDKDLVERDLEEYQGWVISRVLVFGNGKQAAGVRRYFGDEAILGALGRRDIDARTRNYWNQILGGDSGAPEGTGR
jgi:transcriptional regulator with XRE-family HTH domain